MYNSTYQCRVHAEFFGRGYVFRTPEAVLWALNSTDDFWLGLLKIVTLDGDADTTGAVKGWLRGRVPTYFYANQRIR